jgi:RNA-directed DNA polymerase
MQLELFAGTADSSKEAVVVAEAGRPVPAANGAPKPAKRNRGALPAMAMEEIAAKQNLMEALEKVKANDGAPGPDRQSVEAVYAARHLVLPTLRKALLEGTYEPGMVRRVWIPKGGGGQRGLGIPNVIDRWVQQAVYQIMNPHYDPTFHDSSHGFREGRSCHTAIAEAIRYLEDGYEVVVDIDLEKFFDRVNHDRLLSRLAERIEDGRLLKLIRRMLKAKVILPDGVVVTNDEGTPQGGPLSPLLSNIVLDELDRELTRRGHRFVRYADDCNIYVRSERSGHRVMASISQFIERRLRLKVNQAKSAVARPEDRHFLGFRLRREPLDGSVEILLSERSSDRMYEKIRTKTPRNWGQSVAACIQGLNSYLRGWMGFFLICTSGEERSFQTFDAHIRRRLRAIILKQWKRKRTIARRLIALGVSSRLAWSNLFEGRRSLWVLSHCPAVDHGLRNAYFAERGLSSLVELWRTTHRQATVPIQARLFSG